MGLTDEQVAELRRLSERTMKDIIRHGDDQETIEALQEGVIALLADRDSLRARVGELEAGILDAAKQTCLRCGWEETPERDQFGDWVHHCDEREPFTRGCDAALLWDILKPKEAN